MTMDACTSETNSETTDLIARQPFSGKERLAIVEGFYERGTSSHVCLYDWVWSKLHEELLVYIFVRLPVKDILQIRSLSKSWRSRIMSSQFQGALGDASRVRIALMVSDVVSGTMFLTQENKEECFRIGVDRSVEVVGETKIAATTDGLVCILEYDEQPRRYYQLEPLLLRDFGIAAVRVFVMNVVTGVHRKLPPPNIMTSLPTHVRVVTNLVEGGYTITFIYTKNLTPQSWKFLLATFHKETKVVNVFNLKGSSAVIMVIRFSYHIELDM